MSFVKAGRKCTRLRRSMIGEKAGPNVPPSPFCLPFLEAPRGLVASPRDGRRASSMARGARGVHDAGVRVVVAPVCGVSPRHQGRRGNWRSCGDRLLRSERLARRDHVRPVVVEADLKIAAAILIPQGRPGRPGTLLRKARASAAAIADRTRGGVGQAAAGALVCCQSLSGLCAALVSRHCDRAADRPRRKKRSMGRLNLVSAKIGSIIVWRLP